jgi:hypothetical protein
MHQPGVRERAMFLAGLTSLRDPVPDWDPVEKTTGPGQHAEVARDVGRRESPAATSSLALASEPLIACVQNPLHPWPGGPGLDHGPSRGLSSSRTP